MIRSRVLLADDHRMVAEGLRNILMKEFDLVGVVEDGVALVAAAKTLQPDVIVADISMPRLNGLAALEELKKQRVRSKVVFLTMHQNVTYARRALDAGASGFVLKHSAAAELVVAIRAALEGKCYLTPVLAAEVLHEMRRDPSSVRDPAASLTVRQREILQLCAEGRSAKEIASTLSISSRTVEFHKYQLMTTLRLHNSIELTHFAIKHGIVSI
jgi:DNA-binding NarL/FixJ family response regulator